MADAKAARRQPAKLSFADGEVMVTPQDRDIFFISAKRATEACRDALHNDQTFKRFESEILLPLHLWCDSHADRVQSCYLPIPTGSIRAFVITNSPKYDFELGEGLATLELSLARAGWRVSVTQIPDAEGDSLGTFFSSEGALEVYAQRVPTLTEGGD
jgi:hypothetical protein